MTRKEAQKKALFDIEQAIKKYGEDQIYLMAPQPKKNTWILREIRESIINNVPLENGSNIIDDYIKLDKELKRIKRKGLIDEYL